MTTLFADDFTGSVGAGVAGRSNNGITWTAISGVSDMKLDGAGNALSFATGTTGGCEITLPAEVLTEPFVVTVRPTAIAFVNENAVTVNIGAIGFVLKGVSSLGGSTDVLVGGTLVLDNEDVLGRLVELEIDPISGDYELRISGFSPVTGTIDAELLTDVVQVYVGADFASGTRNALSEFSVATVGSSTALIKDNFSGVADTLLSSHTPDILGTPASWDNTTPLGANGWELDGSGSVRPVADSERSALLVPFPADIARMVFQQVLTLPSGVESKVTFSVYAYDGVDIDPDYNFAWEITGADNAGAIEGRFTLVGSSAGTPFSNGPTVWSASEAEATSEAVVRVEIEATGGVDLFINGFQVGSLSALNKFFPEAGGLFTPENFIFSFLDSHPTGGAYVPINSIQIDLYGEGGPPPSPSEFWTGFVNTYEVV